MWKEELTMETLINITNLTKSYGKKQVLKNVNLQMNKGQIIGLLGPNGSGKTTLIKILCGLLKAYDGEVSIDGRNVGQYTKSVISYLPDEPYFANWMKAKDAVKLFCDMYTDFDHDRCQMMMSRFGIENNMMIKTMSKGTKEKFQLCLVMARKAKIIILDEPIGGVDPAARDIILDTILSNYSEEQTILIATHLIADIERIFDSVIFLKEGNIILDGDVETIRQDSNQSIDEMFRDKFKY